MDKEASVIRRDIDQTRTALAQKLTLLEGHVKETLEHAKSSVEQTIDTVTETVTTVKDSLNIRRQVEQHPWIMVSLSVGTGFLMGRWIGGNQSSSRMNYYSPGISRPASDYPFVTTEGTPNADAEMDAEIYRRTPAPAPARGSYPYRPRRSKSALFSAFTDFFHDEIQMAKGMLLTAAIEKVREAATQAFPEIRQNIDKIVDSAEHKIAPDPKN